MIQDLMDNNPNFFQNSSPRLSSVVHHLDFFFKEITTITFSKLLGSYFELCSVLNTHRLTREILFLYHKNHKDHMICYCDCSSTVVLFSFKSKICLGHPQALISSTFHFSKTLNLFSLSLSLRPYHSCEPGCYSPHIPHHHQYPPDHYTYNNKLATAMYRLAFPQREVPFSNRHGSDSGRPGTYPNTCLRWTRPIQSRSPSLPSLSLPLSSSTLPVPHLSQFLSLPPLQTNTQPKPLQTPSSSCIRDIISLTNMSKEICYIWRACPNDQRSTSLRI